MNKKLVVNVLLTCCILSLAACASTGSDALTRLPSSSRQDGAKIAAVERSAEQRGTDIVWVNPPEIPRPRRHY